MPSGMELHYCAAIAPATHMTHLFVGVALRDLFAAYVEAKQAQNVFDYDDLLLYWAQTVSDSRLAGDIGGRFDHVLVDEYQDTNRLQSSILMALKPGGEGLTVVGDDAQSIYSFRAASVRNILDFPTAFRPAAEIITLDRNYRSTQPILAAANGVIDLAAERFTKNLWTERQSGDRPRLVSVHDEADQARYVVEKVLEHRECGAALKQQAVLFRTSHHSGPLEVELTRRNIPFVKFGGLKFPVSCSSRHRRNRACTLRLILARTAAVWSSPVGPHGAALPTVRGGALAQCRQDHAHVRSRCRERVPSAALARNRWQTGVPRLRLHDLLRVPPVGGFSAMALQGMPP